MSNFSERLKTKRKEAGFTQPELAEKLGVSKGAVANWEVGDHIPSREKIRAIAEILKTAELYLSGESEIDLGAFADEPKEYSAALPFSRMTQDELEFIYESRQKQLNETNDPQKRRELFGIISEASSELQKRIPQKLETEIARRGINAGDSREVKPEEKKK
jgi:transcriptional regulator with XRE-family HTH domain